MKVQTLKKTSIASLALIAISIIAYFLWKHFGLPESVLTSVMLLSGYVFLFLVLMPVLFTGYAKLVGKPMIDKILKSPTAMFFFVEEWING